MKSALVGIAMLLLGASATQAQIKKDPNSVYWVFYRYENTDATTKMRAIENFSGIVFALGFANASLGADKQSLLYCSPNNFYTVGQHVDLLKQWVRDQKAQERGAPGYSSYIDNLPVAMAMLMALKETFPCNQKARP